MNKKIFTIPNLLSFIRIILVPIIVVLYLKKHMVAATVLVVVSGASDMLDGFIARTFNQVSDLGKLLDPIADKLTMLAVVFLVAIHHLPMRVMLYVMMAQEGIMLLGALVLFKTGARTCQSKLFGKLATAALYVTIFTVMLTDVIGFVSGGAPILSEKCLWIMAAVCCALMIAALIQYIVIFILMNQGKYDFDANETHTLLKMQKTPRRGFYNQNGGG